MCSAVVGSDGQSNRNYKEKLFYKKMLLATLFILIIISLAWRYNFQWNSKRTKTALSFTLFTWLTVVLGIVLFLLIYISIKHKADLTSLLYYFLIYILPSILQGLWFSLPAIFIHIILNYIFIKDGIHQKRTGFYVTLSGFIGIFNLITITIMDTEESLVSFFRNKESLYFALTMFALLLFSALISLRMHRKRVD